MENIDYIEYKGKKYMTREATILEDETVCIAEERLEDDMNEEWNTDPKTMHLDEQIYAYADADKIRTLDQEAFDAYIEGEFT